MNRYQSVSIRSHLAETTIEGSPEGMTDAQLAKRARPVPEGITGTSLPHGEEYPRLARGRWAAMDTAQAARAARTRRIISSKCDDEIETRIIEMGGCVTGVRRGMFLISAGRSPPSCAMSREENGLNVLAHLPQDGVAVGGTRSEEG